MVKTTPDNFESTIATSSDATVSRVEYGFSSRTTQTAESLGPYVTSGLHGENSSISSTIITLLALSGIKHFQVTDTQQQSMHPIQS